MLRDTIRAGLARQQDAKHAAGAQAYLKSAMPLRGVAMPALRQLCVDAFAKHPISMAADWRRAVSDLWDHATHREERYAAIELAAHPPYQRFISLALLPLYRRMIQEGAWWDLVDPLAGRVGVLLATYPDRIKPTLRAWARHESIWLRRVAILSQLGFDGQTDWALLADCIAPSLASTDPFVRKAIGWALRDYAKSNPGEVKAYLAGPGAALAPIAKREALKGLTQAKKPAPARRPTLRSK